MKSKSILAAALVLFAGAGCVTPVVPYVYKTTDYDGFVAVARKASFNEAGANAVVQIDGKGVVSLKNGQHCMIAVAPGPHRIAVGADTGAKSDERDVTVAAGEMAFFIVRPNSGAAAARLIPLVGDIGFKKLMIEAATQAEFAALAAKGAEQIVLYSR